MRFLLAFALVQALSSCADPTYAPLFPQAAGVGDTQSVLVVTNRERESTGFYGSKRREDHDYLELTVSIPQERKLGAIPLSYRRAEPGRHFVMAARKDMAGRDGFRKELKRQLAALPADERDITIYVHGYNNSFSDGVFRAAQLAHDFELRGIALHYSWPSIAHPLGYSHDRDSLLFARDGLEDMLRDVAGSGAQNVVLVGHSLGAMLVMETLRQIDIAQPGQPDRWLDGVVLLSPDVDLDLFKAQADRISALPQPFAIFVSQKDRALMLSSQINGRSQRLGSLSDPRALAELKVTVLDVTAFSDSVMQSHFTTGNSPALIKLLSRSDDLSNAFAVPSVRGRGGLPGVALTVQSATQIILSPGLLAR